MNMKTRSQGRGRWGKEASGVSISPAVELLELNVLAPSPAAENLPNPSHPQTSNPPTPRPTTTPHHQSRGHPAARISPINSAPSCTSAIPFTPAQCPDPRRTQRGSRPRGHTPVPSPTAHPTSSPASCNRRKTQSRLSRLHHTPGPMASPRRRSRRSSVCGRRHGRPGWLNRARAWTGGLSLGGGLRIAHTRAWFIR